MCSIPVKERAIRNGYSNVATARIAVAAKIDRSYSPGGTNSHPYQYVRGYFGPYEFPPTASRSVYPFLQDSASWSWPTHRHSDQGFQGTSRRKNSPCMRRCGLKTTTQRNARLYVRRRRVSYNEWAITLLSSPADASISFDPVLGSGHDPFTPVYMVHAISHYWTRASSDKVKVSDGNIFLTFADILQQIQYQHTKCQLD